MMDDRTLAQIARRWIAVRRCRERFFPADLFDESAWDMLMLLFVAQAEDRTVTDEQLMAEAGCRAGTGHRWVAHLEQDGQISRADGSAIRLTADARDRMRRFLAEAAEV